MNAVAKAQELNAHLLRDKIVEVEDADGSTWTFKIQQVPLSTWDIGDAWFKDIREKTPEEFAAKLGNYVEAPSREAMSRVLVAGVQEPEVTEVKKNGTVWVGDLLRRDILALCLYSEISNFSCEGILKVEVRKNAPSATAKG